MVFSSLLFMFRFLPVVLVLYFAAPRKVRNLILFVFSLFFYAWGEPRYVFLMLFSITMDYTMGRLISKFKEQGKLKKAKFALAFSVTVNLGILAFFKYADFIIGSINGGLGVSLPMPGVPLPILFIPSRPCLIRWMYTGELRRYSAIGLTMALMFLCFPSLLRGLLCSIRPLQSR